MLIAPAVHADAVGVVLDAISAGRTNNNQEDPGYEGGGDDND